MINLFSEKRGSVAFILSVGQLYLAAAKQTKYASIAMH
jgi:hypothetical protein